MTELAIALVTLTFLEIVLGVDNVIFISILSGKLRKEQQKRARRVGLMMAMLMRLALLFSITWMARLTRAAVHVLWGRDLRPRPDPDRRRAVPAREGDLRDPRQARGPQRRARTGWRRRSGASSSR